jgi:hypothetical protein
MMMMMIIIIIYLLSRVTELSDASFNTMRLCRETSPDFFVVFPKLRSATISFVMSVRPCVTTRFALDGFS